MRAIEILTNFVYMDGDVVAYMVNTASGWFAGWMEDDLPQCLDSPTRDDAIAFILAELWG